LFAYDLHELCEDSAGGAGQASVRREHRSGGAYLRERLIDLVYDIYKLIEHYIELRRAIVPTKVSDESAYIAYLVDKFKSLDSQAVARKQVAAILGISDEEVDKVDNAMVATAGKKAMARAGDATQMADNNF
jgi:hypothetical protein